MNPEARKRLLLTCDAPTNWHPERGGWRGPICFDDDRIFDLGPDPGGASFRLIADKMMRGDYYPPDAVVFYRSDDSAHRDLQPGDRILQCATFARLFKIWSCVEIWVAKSTETTCHIGYVTTRNHVGRGIWEAHLNYADQRLTLRVTSTAAPASWQFWLGLPVARALQLRARRRAVEEFRKLISGNPNTL